MGLRDFIGIVREMSFDKLKAEAMLAPRLLVIARDLGDAQLWRQVLFGNDAEIYVEAHSYVAPPKDPLQYDVIVTIGPLQSGIARDWRELFHRVDEPMRVVEIPPGSPQDPATLDAIRFRLADVADERSIAIGRYIDAMRTPCANQIIASTASSNGQFAFISNIPTIIPAIGSLVAVGADFLVLTKNQLMMIYKLAAVYERDLNDQWTIYTEMVPVIGAGLVWRTIAREVSALLPFMIGTVPKVAIAYAGTFAAGRAAATYYEQGIKLNWNQMRALYAEAIDRINQNPLPLPRALKGGRDHKDQSPNGKEG